MTLAQRMLVMNQGRTEQIGAQHQTPIREIGTERQVARLESQPGLLKLRRTRVGDHRIGVIAECCCLAAAEEEADVTAIDVVGKVPQSFDRIAAVVFRFRRVALDVGFDKLLELYQEAIVLAVVAQADGSEHECCVGGHFEL